MDVEVTTDEPVTARDIVQALIDGGVTVHVRSVTIVNTANFVVDTWGQR